MDVNALPEGRGGSFDTLAGRWQSGQLHQTVNLAPHGYGGSNPPLPTIGCVRGDLVELLHVKDVLNRCGVPLNSTDAFFML